MRNRIFGGIGVFWGAGILARWFFYGTEGGSAYQSGQNVAVIFGAVMLVVGAWYFMRSE